MQEKKPFEKRLAEQWTGERHEIKASDRAVYAKGGRPKRVSGFAAQFVAQANPEHTQNLFAMREFEPEKKGLLEQDKTHTTAFGEYVPGDAVRDILEGKSRHITKEEFYRNVQKIIDDYASAIASNYRLGVTHGDTGVQNVVVTPELRVKLIDWKKGGLHSEGKVQSSWEEMGLPRDYQFALDYFMDRIARSHEEQVRFRQRFHKTFMKKLVGDEVPAEEAPTKPATVKDRYGPFTWERRMAGGYKTTFEREWPDMRTAAEAVAKENGIETHGKSLHELVVALGKKGIEIGYTWGEQTA